MAIEDQVEVISEIVQIMNESAESKYEEMQCTFNYFSTDGDWSIESEFSYVRNGKMHRTYLGGPMGYANKLAHQLRELVRNHSGGEWKTATISIDVNGRAKASFVY